MKKPRGLRARLAVAFAGAVLATMVVFAGVVLAVVAHNEAQEVHGATTEEEGEDSVERVLFAMALASPLVLAGAVAFGLWLARTALSPMRDASERARAARASELDLSLPVGGSGDEWDELASTLNALLADARASMVRIRRFTADAAHELKTPLTAIIGMAEVAVRRDRPAPEYREALDEVLDESVRLARLVDALLTLARADSGILLTARPEVDIAELARDAARRLGALHPSAPPVGLEVGPLDAPVRGDPLLLGRVLENLLENAFRHGAAPFRVKIEQRGRELLVDVTDQGTGVPPQFVPRLFERFARDDAAREGTGHGLGLAIAHAIAVAHGGTLALVPSTVGADFRLCLPL